MPGAIDFLTKGGIHDHVRDAIFRAMRAADADLCDQPQTKAEPLEAQLIDWLKDLRPDAGLSVLRCNCDRIGDEARAM